MYRYLFAVLFFLLCFSESSAKEYAIGIPLKHENRIYDSVFKALESKGFIVGDNLSIKEYDLQSLRGNPEAAGRFEQKASSEIDLFFLTGDQLDILFETKITKPVVFISVTDNIHNIPEHYRGSVTGVFRDSPQQICLKTAHYFKQELPINLGLLYSADSGFKSLVPQIIKNCPETVVKYKAVSYSDIDELEEVFKNLTNSVSGVVVFPPAVPGEHVGELLRMQMKYKLPLLGQSSEQVKAGFMGGAVTERSEIIPKLAGYISEVLKGRDVSQLPLFQTVGRYYINLNTVSSLGVYIPEDVIKKSKIIGAASKPVVTKKSAVKPLKGSYIIAVSDTFRKGSLEFLASELQEHGLYRGENLKFIEISRNLGKNSDFRDENGRIADAVLINCMSFPGSRALDLKIPVLFLGNSDAVTNFVKLNSNSTGLAFRTDDKTLIMLLDMIEMPKTIHVLGKSCKTFNTVRESLASVSSQVSGADFDIHTVSSGSEAEKIFAKLDRDKDVVFMLSDFFTEADSDEILKMQFKYKIPVYSSSISDVRKGFIGGPVIDTKFVIPKAGDYLGLMIKGVNPVKLPVFFYTSRYSINLQTLQEFGLKMPDFVIKNSIIVR